MSWSNTSVVWADCWGHWVSSLLLEKHTQWTFKKLALSWSWLWNRNPIPSSQWLNPCATPYIITVTVVPDCMPLGIYIPVISAMCRFEFTKPVVGLALLLKMLQEVVAVLLRMVQEVVAVLRMVQEVVAVLRMVQEVVAVLRTLQEVVMAVLRTLQEVVMAVLRTLLWQSSLGRCRRLLWQSFLGRCRRLLWQSFLGHCKRLLWQSF